MKEKLVPKKLDKDEVARRLQDELKGVNIDKIAAGVEAEMNDLARHEKRQVLG